MSSVWTTIQTAKRKRSPVQNDVPSSSSTSVPSSSRATTKRRRSLDAQLTPTSASTLTPTTTTTNAARVVHKFMRNTKTRRQARYLGHICSNSGTCVAFGVESKKIRTFFDGYTNFAHARQYLTRIGQDSVNGFVMELAYQKQGYIGTTILKSSRTPGADNLYYEFLVGQYLNRQAIRFPCFVETYGLFHYRSDAAYNSMVAAYASSATFTGQAKGLIPWSRQEIALLYDAYSYHYKPAHLQIACNLSQRLVLQTQYYPGAVTLHQLILDRKSVRDLSFFHLDLPAILYQIYGPLSALLHSFAHRDLHANNVLIYMPHPDYSMEFMYHRSDGTVVQFQTRYLAKIIDYGRCYFNDQESVKATTMSSHRVASDVCRVPACNQSVAASSSTATTAATTAATKREPQSCGNRSGFSYLSTYATTTALNADRLLSAAKKHDRTDSRLMRGVYNLAKIHMPYEIGVSEDSDIIKLSNADKYEEPLVQIENACLYTLPR